MSGLAFMIGFLCGALTVFMLWVVKSWLLIRMAVRTAIVMTRIVIKVPGGEWVLTLLEKVWEEAGEE